jgi:hypothetical protein
MAAWAHLSRQVLLTSWDLDAEEGWDEEDI